MLGCANWRGVRLFRELSFFTLFVIQKSFIACCVSSRFTVSGSLIVRLVARSIGGPSLLRAGSES